VLPQQSQFYLLLVDSWPITFLWIFYLLFATSIFLKIKKKLLFISAIIILLTIAGFYVSPYTTFRLKSVTSPILLEFLMGLSIFWLSNKQRIPEYAAYSFLLLGISGFIYNIFYGDNEVFRTRGDLDQIYELKRVLQFGVPSALLVAGSVVLEQKERLNKVWNNRFFQLTGNASYSIFLIYPSVYFLLMVFYVQIVGTIPNADLNIFMHMPIAWGIGILFYRKVECPIKEMIKNPAHYFAKG
jgi:peptidoglycan/LPS O-acetylase OafA/YrhL